MSCFYLTMCESVFCVSPSSLHPSYYTYSHTARYNGIKNKGPTNSQHGRENEPSEGIFAKILPPKKSYYVLRAKGTSTLVFSLSFSSSTTTTTTSTFLHYLSPHHFCTLDKTGYREYIVVVFFQCVHTHTHLSIAKSYESTE